MLRSLALLPCLCLLGCPGSGGSADSQASPGAALAAYSAAARAGDWERYYDLTSPDTREALLVERVAAVIADARGGSRAEASRACLKTIGVDYEALPEQRELGNRSVEDYDAERAAWRKALLGQISDPRVAYAETLRLREQINTDERFTPQKLLDPGQPGEVVLEGEDRAHTATTHAGGGGADLSRDVSLRRVDGRWYVDYDR